MKTIFLFFAFSLFSLHAYCADSQKQIAPFLAQLAYGLQNNAPITDEHQYAKNAINFIVPAVKAPLPQEERTKKVKQIKWLLNQLHTLRVNAIELLESNQQWHLCYSCLINKKDAIDIKNQSYNRTVKEISRIRNGEITQKEVLKNETTQHSLMQSACTALLTMDKDELSEGQIYCKLNKIIYDIETKWKR